MKIDKELLSFLVKEEIKQISEATDVGHGYRPEATGVGKDLRKKTADAASAEKEAERVSPANFAARIQALEDEVYRLKKHKLTVQDVEQVIQQVSKPARAHSVPGTQRSPISSKS